AGAMDTARRLVDPESPNCLTSLVVTIANRRAGNARPCWICIFSDLEHGRRGICKSRLGSRFHVENKDNNEVHYACFLLLCGAGYIAVSRMQPTADYFEQPEHGNSAYRESANNTGAKRQFRYESDRYAPRSEYSARQPGPNYAK